MWHHRLLPVGMQQAVLMVDNIDARIHQMRIVERLEGVKLFCRLLRGTIASQQVTVEVDSYLWRHRMTVGILGSRNLYRGDEILLAVSA